MENKKRVSRQRKWQRARVADGKCMSCGVLRNRYATLCDACQGKVRNKRRQERLAELVAMVKKALAEDAV